MCFTCNLCNKCGKITDGLYDMSLNPLKCPDCGLPAREGERKCGKCGRSLPPTVVTTPGISDKEPDMPCNVE